MGPDLFLFFFFFDAPYEGELLAFLLPQPTTLAYTEARTRAGKQYPIDNQTDRVPGPSEGFTSGRIHQVLGVTSCGVCSRVDRMRGSRNCSLTMRSWFWP